MSDEWNSYICNVNDKLASIFVDIGIRPHVPDESKPWLLWVWVYFKKPRLDGLSSGEEFDVLISLEDKLVASMQQSCDAILSGRITTDGRREFYFYAPKSEGFDRAVRASLGSFHGYKFDFNKQRDSGWTQYLNVLYPSEEQLELIGNRDLLDSLKRQGDNLEKARNVCHWAYFNSQTDREVFREAVLALGYRIVSENEYPESDRQFGICIEKMQDMAPDKVDLAVTQLFRASKSAHGEYDGWECQVILDAKPKSEKPWWRMW
jgi:uncharacterized protein (TIGR01619 family)